MIQSAFRRTVLGLLAAATVSLASNATAQEPPVSVPGLVVRPSDASVHETASRFAEQARTSGMTVFARIDHRQGAMSRDMALLPTEVIIFGDPKGGTPLMQCAQTAGIDLPMKVLVWRDNSGQTWLGYNDPAWIAERHDASDCAAVGPLQQTMKALVNATLD